MHTDSRVRIVEGSVCMDRKKLSAPSGQIPEYAPGQYLVLGSVLDCGVCYASAEEAKNKRDCLGTCGGNVIIR